MRLLPDPNSGVQLEDVDGVDVFNNTFYGNGHHTAGGTSQLFLSDGYTDAVVKNNIFYSLIETTAGFGIVGATAQLTADYNLYYRVNNTPSIFQYGGTDYHYNDRNAIIALGYESHSVFADPTFTSSSDYTLQAGSPAIGAGIGVGLTTDYAGNAWASTPSIGAYEYDADPPTPTDLATVETNTTYTAKSILCESGANVTDDGGGTISARGLCWATSVNPTISNSKVSATGTTGTFTATLTELTSNTTYHVRAYVTNESGTSYGADVSFTTKVYTHATNSGKVLVNNGKIIVIQ